MERDTETRHGDLYVNKVYGKPAAGEKAIAFGDPDEPAGTGEPALIENGSFTYDIVDTVLKPSNLENDETVWAAIVKSRMEALERNSTMSADSGLPITGVYTNIKGEVNSVLSVNWDEDGSTWPILEKFSKATGSEVALVGGWRYLDASQREGSTQT